MLQRLSVSSNLDEAGVWAGGGWVRFERGGDSGVFSTTHTKPKETPRKTKKVYYELVDFVVTLTFWT